MKISIFLFAIGMFAFSFDTVAQVNSAEDAAPVTISAAKGLEWNRAAKTYTARGDVIAKKGQAEIRSDSMTASYSDADSNISISEIKATGRVVLSSPPYTAYGDEGTYDVKTGNAVLTGKDLRVEAGEERLTAKDSLAYDAGENRMTALGVATATKQGRVLKADRLIAWFDKDDKGKMVARKIEADGHISITTGKETVTGDNGVYDPVTGQAVLTGSVRIAQGQSHLDGARATVDMNTGISHLFADGKSATKGRVTGVFYPTARKQDDGKK